MIKSKRGALRTVEAETASHPVLSKEPGSSCVVKTILIFKGPLEGHAKVNCGKGGEMHKMLSLSGSFDKL